MNKFLLSLFISSSLFARTEVLEETLVTDKRGNSYYILSVCKDGLLYTAVTQEDMITISMAQEFAYDIDKKKVSEVKCQYDFKSEQELEKINKDRR